MHQIRIVHEAIRRQRWQKGAVSFGIPAYGAVFVEAIAKESERWPAIFDRQINKESIVARRSMHHSCVPDG